MSAPRTPTLRPYQHTALADVRAAWASGKRRVLLVAPTGAGKTVTFAAVAADYVARGLRVLIVAHRKELLTQADAKVRATGIRDVLVYRGGKVPSAPPPVVIASIQSLKRRLFDADLVVIDEAHHAVAPTYLRLLEWYPDAEHLGPTATPWWGTGKGLGAYFEAVVVSSTVRELTALGHLARVRMFTHPHTLRDLDLRGLASNGSGDYATTSLMERVDRPTLLGDIVAHWQSHAGNARTLCFAASVEHSRHIVARFRDAGIAAEHLDGDTPDGERTAILARLVSGETLVVSNYGVLTEGFDAPEVGCVILARPTKRPGVYMQAAGRGLRTTKAKRSVVMLDHGGCCILHGLPDTERAVSLEGLGEENNTGNTTPRVPVRRCPACGLMLPLAVKVCPECSVSLRREVATEEPTGALVEVVTDARRGPITINGRTQTGAAWAREIGISEPTFDSRLRRGMTGAKLLAPARKMAPMRTLTIDGRTQSVGKWAREKGTSINAIVVRMKRGLPDAECVIPASERHASVGSNLRASRATGDGINARLAQARIAAGLSRAALAEKSGIGRATIELIENSSYGVSITKIRKVADALGVVLEGDEAA